MALIRFKVPGQPHGKERPRQGRGGVFYTPDATRDYEQAVQVYARQAMARDGLKALVGPVLLLVMAVYAIPKAWSKARREANARVEELCMSRPDFDNVGKAVADALNGIAWADDAQVACGAVLKVYGETPMVGVLVYPATDHRAFVAALSDLLERSNASST